MTETVVTAPTSGAGTTFAGATRDNFKADNASRSLKRSHALRQLLLRATLVVAFLTTPFAGAALLCAALVGWSSPARAQDPTGALRALHSAPPSTAEPSMAGEWAGQYYCGQGLTGVRLVVPADTSPGLFYFFALPENPGVPEGCFLISAKLAPASGDVNLTAGKWIVRPENYATVNATGRLDATGQAFEGRVIGPRGCSKISMARVVPDRPLPIACARALQ